MKKLSYWLSAACLVATLGSSFVSCSKDDDNSSNNNGSSSQTQGQAPVKDVDFTVTVDGNKITINGSEIATAGKFANFDGKQYNFNEDGIIEIVQNLKGDYKGTVSVLINGQTFTSEEFTVTIANSDLSYMQEEIWKYLTGGTEGYSKKWRLDYIKVTTTTIDNTGKKVTSSGYTNQVWGGNIYYGGTFGTTSGACWGSTSYDEWGGSNPEVGYITFDGSTKTCHLVLEKGFTKADDHATADKNEKGETIWTGAGREEGPIDREGSFDLEISDRDWTITDKAQENKNWWKELVFNGSFYSYFAEDENLKGFSGTHVCSKTTAVVKFDATSGVRFPLNARVADPAFTDDDLYNRAEIIQIDDYSMLVQMHRTYEGWNGASSNNPSEYNMYYAFVCDGAPELIDPEIPNHGDCVASDVDIKGSYEVVSLGWIDWKTASLYDAIPSLEDAVAMGSWCATEENVKSATKTIDFTNAGKLFIDEKEVATYTQDGAYITFDKEVKIQAGNVTLEGKNIYVCAPKNAIDGYVYIGLNSPEGKNETPVIAIKHVPSK